MTASSRSKGWPRFFLEVVIYFSLIVIAAVLFGLLIGWQTLYEFGTGFFIAAIVALVAGAAKAVGFGMSREPKFQYGQTITRETPSDRVRKDFAESFSEQRFALQMVVVAVLCFALSGLVQSIR